MVQKKLLIFSLVIFIIILIPILISLIYYFGPRQTNKKADLLINKARSEILLSTNSKLPDSIETIFKGLTNDSLSQKEKYETLKKLSYYFSSVYDETHAPGIRQFTSDVMGKYAKDNFPKYYIADNFIISCADPVCGEKLDPQIEKVLKDISSIEIPNEEKNVVKYNLTLATYMSSTPTSKDFEEKRFGMRLAAQQLKHYGNPKASEAAKLIESYFLNKYKSEL